MRAADASQYHKKVGTVHFTDPLTGLTQTHGELRVASGYLTIHSADGMRRRNPIPVSAVHQVDVDGQPNQLALQ